MMNKEADTLNRKVIRTPILKTRPALRNPNRNPKRPRSENKAKRKKLFSRLEAAKKQRDFYAKLYGQYSADLLKMSLYVRKIMTTPALNAYLKEHHAATLRDISEIVLATLPPQTPP